MNKIVLYCDKRINIKGDTILILASPIKLIRYFGQGKRLIVILTMHQLLLPQHPHL